MKADAAAGTAPAGVDAAHDVAPASLRPLPLEQGGLLDLVGYAATRASVRLKKEFVRGMGALALKPVEFSVLTLVAVNRHVTPKRVGQTLDLSPPNLAVVLDRLTQRGLIERQRNEEDRREQLLQLSASGHELQSRAAEIATAMERDAVNALSEAERLLLIELLQKVSRGRLRRGA